MEPQVSGLQAVCSRGRENGKVLAGKMWSTLWRSKRWRQKRGVYFWFISKYLNTLSLTVRHCWLPLSAFVRRLKASVKHAGYASANIARTIYVTHYFLTVVDEVREIRTWVKVWIGLVSVMTSLLRPTVELVQSLSTTESSVLVSILCFTQTDSHLQLHLMHHTRFLSNQVTLMHTL